MLASVIRRYGVQCRTGRLLSASLIVGLTRSYNLQHGSGALSSQNSTMSQEVSRDITRLTYHSRKRGILETTLILSRFADDHLASLSDQDRTDYERLIMSNDWSEWDLYRYLTADEHRLDVPDQVRAWPVFWQIREMLKQKGGVANRSDNTL
jgi:succinate dehydrogenase assembly factor 2